MAPNYVGPFVSVGRVFAPRYRQASLYSLTTLREDAREARQFAYVDVSQAFRHYLANDNGCLKAGASAPYTMYGYDDDGSACELWGAPASLAPLSGEGRRLGIRRNNTARTVTALEG